MKRKYFMLCELAVSVAALICVLYYSYGVLRLLLAAKK